MVSHPATRISFIYLAVALPWVLASDLLVRVLVPTVAVENILASVKGAGFVLLTAGMLFVLVRRSIGELVAARELAESGEAELNALVTSMDDVVFTADREGRITRLMGPGLASSDPADFIGKTASELFGPDVGSQYAQLQERVLAGERVSWEWFRETVPLLGSDRALGPISAMKLSMSPLRDAAGQIVGSVGVGQDISQLRDLEAQRDSAESRLAYLAHHDHLTGLPNRVMVQDRMEQALIQAARNGTHVGVHFIDLDGFKDINDSMGHAAGDELLRAVAQRLSLVVRRADTLARLGGDEFVIIQNNVTDVAGAARLADRLIEALAIPFTIEGREFHVRASVGVAFAPQDGNDLSDLFRAADTAMYQAKQRGGGRFELYSAEVGEAVRKRLQMANELRSAIQAGAIEVAFQPIVGTRTRAIVALEALARWTSQSYGSVPPDTFIPLAESTGQILALDDLVRAKTMGYLREWFDRGVAVPVHINVSPLRLVLADFERDLAASVMAAGVPNELVVFEITESTLVDGSGDVVEALTWLRDQGFGLAADDFGTGYSMLNYLKLLPLTVVKTDRSFVEDLATERDRTILRRVIMLGHDLGYEVVVEGIETEEQRRLVEDCEADACQGFLFSRPLTPEQATQFLSDGRR